MNPPRQSLSHFTVWGYMQILDTYPGRGLLLGQKEKDRFYEADRKVRNLERMNEVHV